MEELCMMPVYQVFIMVLIQGATRSGFHQGTFSFFSFFSFFQKELKISQVRQHTYNVSYDKPRPQQGMLKDDNKVMEGKLWENERQMEDKVVGFGRLK